MRAGDNGAGNVGARLARIFICSTRTAGERIRYISSPGDETADYVRP